MMIGIIILSRTNLGLFFRISFRITPLSQKRNVIIIKLAADCYFLDVRMTITGTSRSLLHLLLLFVRVRKE